jgi:RNA polymerase primary sigma factor
VPEKEDPESPPDSPLLDLPGVAIRKMIKQAKKCGYVTYKQLSSVLSSGEVATEHIEDILATLNEMGINVVEPEEAETEGEEQGAEPEFEESEGSVPSASAPSSHSSSLFSRSGTDLSGVALAGAFVGAGLFGGCPATIGAPK